MTGLPSIALVTVDGGFFDYTYFKDFEAFYIPDTSSVVFATPAHAGQENTITFMLNLTIGMQAEDTYEIHLPGFWSSRMRLVVDHVSLYKASWDQCSEVLTITSIGTFQTLVNFTIEGLRLPIDGVTSLLTSAIYLTGRFHRRIYPLLTRRLISCTLQLIRAQEGSQVHRSRRFQLSVTSRRPQSRSVKVSYRMPGY